jgi:hypothetical protein
MLDISSSYAGFRCIPPASQLEPEAIQCPCTMLSFETTDLLTVDTLVLSDGAQKILVSIVRAQVIGRFCFSAVLTLLLYDISESWIVLNEIELDWASVAQFVLMIKRYAWPADSNRSS